MNSYLHLRWLFWQLCWELRPKSSEEKYYTKRGWLLLYPSVLQSANTKSVKITVAKVILPFNGRKKNKKRGEAKLQGHLGRTE